MIIRVVKLTLWFYVKTTDDPPTVGDIVCRFNETEGKHSGDKYSWIIQLGKGEPGYWEIKGKYARLTDLTEIGIIYRIGDTVVLAEVDDDLAPDFIDPLITKYGFDNVKWIAVPNTR